VFQYADVQLVLYIQKNAALKVVSVPSLTTITADSASGQSSGLVVYLNDALEVLDLSSLTTIYATGPEQFRDNPALHTIWIRLLC
jgi:hypothetical protein